MRILPPNSTLFKMGIVERPNCHRCTDTVEDTIHIFWQCPTVHTLWNQISDWLQLNLDYVVENDQGLILLNLLPVGWDVPPDAVQLSILLAKKYIWTNRCLKKGVTLAEWVRELENVEESEANIAIRCNKLPLHNLKWGPISSLRGDHDLEGMY